MRRITVRKDLNFTAHQMIELVGDVASYQLFLPWVKAVRIWDTFSQNEGFDAELLIGYKNFRAPFTTNVQITEPNNQIKTKLVPNKHKGMRIFGEPMRALNCQWQFYQTNDGCTIDLQIEYEFADKILAALLSNNIEKASQKLIEAFTNEAKRRYS